jgi:hypothetical protein
VLQVDKYTKTIYNVVKRYITAPVQFMWMEYNRWDVLLSPSQILKIPPEL